MCEKLLVVGLASLPPIDQRPMIVIPIISAKTGYTMPMHDMVKDHSPYYQHIASDRELLEMFALKNAYKLPRNMIMGEGDLLIQTYEELVVLTKQGSWKETLTSFMKHEKEEAIKAAFKALETGDEKKALRLMYYASRCDEPR